MLQCVCNLSSCVCNVMGIEDGENNMKGHAVNRIDDSLNKKDGVILDISNNKLEADAGGL